MEDILKKIINLAPEDEKIKNELDIFAEEFNSLSARKKVDKAVLTLDSINSNLKNISRYINYIDIICSEFKKLF